MKKTEKLKDGTKRVTHTHDGEPDWEGGEFRGEAPPDRSGPINEEMVGTVGAMIPPPTGTEEAEEEEEKKP